MAALVSAMLPCYLCPCCAFAIPDAVILRAVQPLVFRVRGTIVAAAHSRYQQGWDRRCRLVRRATLWERRAMMRDAVIDEARAPDRQDVTEAWFRRRASECLAREPSEAIFDPRTGRAWGRGDWDLNPELLADFAAMPPARPAAVLIGVVPREELTVLLTQRTHTLPTQAGQIAFRGGKLEAHDNGPVEAALRESLEEIGLESRYVEPLGFLDGYRTGTGFSVAPVVAVVQPGFVLTPDPREVAEVFEVPLSFLMDEANHHRHTREWRGRDRHYYAMPYGERYIWGATAGMLKNMHQRLFGR
jgi:8-oxo-dGTP pyrophosphatase MutT (NUDIX family)